MNKIQKLLKELCPKGVKYDDFGQLATIVRGASPRPIQNFITTKDDGVKWIKIGDVPTGSKYVTSTKEKITPAGAEKSRFVKAGDFILSNSMSFGRPYILKIDGCIHDGWLSISNFEKHYTSDFLYFLLGSSIIQNTMAQRASSGTVQNLNADIVKSIKLPIPPLPIQDEIVRILDNFSRLEEELEAHLEAELEARINQAQHYRKALLTHENGTATSGKQPRWTTLNKIATNLDSRRKPVTKSSRISGEYPYYGASGIVDYVSDYIFDGDYLLISEDGANLLARSTPIAFSISGKTWVNNHAHVLEFKTYTERRFVEIYLNSISLTPYVSGAAQPKLNQENLNKIPIPVRSLEEQERIVTILDKFDALIDGIKEGLSDEVKARRQQYEYYRDQLLSFEEIS